MCWSAEWFPAMSVCHECTDIFQSQRATQFVIDTECSAHVWDYTPAGGNFECMQWVHRHSPKLKITTQFVIQADCLVHFWEDSPVGGIFFCHECMQRVWQIHATRPKPTESRNSNLLVHIQIKPKSQCEFVPRDTEESGAFDLVDLGGVAFSVESVIHRYSPKSAHNSIWWRHWL